jgi:hypothetical protein
MFKTRWNILIVRAVLLSLTWTAALAFVGLCDAQTPAAAPMAPAKRSASAQAPQVYANLAQLMKGILFPNSNVSRPHQEPGLAQVRPGPSRRRRGRV